MIYVIYFIHVVISLFLILVVLLQQGKGADLSVFGGGSSQAAFGARGTASVLHKATVVCFIGFILTTLSIGIMKSRGTSSVMSGVSTSSSQSDSEGASELAGGELPPEEPAAEPEGAAEGEGATPEPEGDGSEGGGPEDEAEEAPAAEDADSGSGANGSQR